MTFAKLLRHLSVMLLLAGTITSYAQIANGQRGSNTGQLPSQDLVLLPSPFTGLAMRPAGYPRLTVDHGNLEYFYMDQLLTANIDEMMFVAGPASAPVPLVNPELNINVFIDNDGNVIGGVSGDDLVLTGAIDLDGDGVIDLNGTLFTAEITSLVAINEFEPGLDSFEFGFALTGGLLADTFGGNVIRLTIIANISTFSGNFMEDLKVLFVDGFLIGKTNLCTGAIGDYIWEDTDGDGIQDADEEGINGVEVSLFDQNGLLQTVTSSTGGPNNAAGYYQFPMLCANTYTVSVDVNTAPVGYVPTIINAPGSDSDNDSDNHNGTTVILMTDDSEDQTIDFGFEPLLGSLGDFVWLDLNNDGVQNIGEPGVSDVTVNLLDCSGLPLDSTMTDMVGFYEFTELPAGCYLVQFELPAGFEFTLQFATDEALDSDANEITGISDPVNLAPGQDDPTIDAGLFLPAKSSLGDFVWNDINMNGMQDPGEPGLEGVTVTLQDCDGNLLEVTSTDDTGFYEFTDLNAGCYKVTFTLPDGFVFSPAFVGSTDTDSNADPSNGMSELITLEIEEDNPTIDAGMYLPPSLSLGDFFWLDTNADGIQDPGETGIPNVVVTLLDCNGTALDVTNTDSNGMYLFDDLDEGCYTVQFTPPANCTLSPALAGGNTALDSNADPLTGLTGDINLAQLSDLTIDAGCYFTAGLGDFVWVDENQNGLQDIDENGIPGVPVELLDMNMQSTGLTTVTGVAGEYSFNDLMPGKYFVQFSMPTGYVFTQQNVGADDTIDSDANGTGKTAIIMLSSGEFDPTIDAGVYIPEDPMIDVEKATNGFDADDPTGPYVDLNGQVTWTYVITNTGNTNLSDITLIDNVIGTIACPFTQLAPMQSDECTATGIATTAGQYANLATVTGTSPQNVEVTDNDPSHYFGSDPSIDIEKSTNGEDADDPTGPSIPAGNAVEWLYVVINTGNVTLTNVVVTDSDPDVTVTCPLTVLQPIGAGISTMTCSATGIAVLGQYANDSDVAGISPTGQEVTDMDPSHYFGTDASITIEKSTNDVDADDPNAGDAPQLEPGDPVTWTYLVTNTGNVTLVNVMVTDSQGVVVTCPQAELLPMQDMLCEGTGVAIDLSNPGTVDTVSGVCGITPNSPLYNNIGVVTGVTPDEDQVTDDDPSHYCNALTCDVSVDLTCLIPMPPSSDYMCDKPIDTLTFVWDGAQSVKIKAYKGSVGSTLLATIDDIMPGEEVSVSGFAGSPNDVYFEVFAAGTNNKLGESNFHLSCSDDAMNGPEDCGLPQGNGKGNNSGLINNWLLEGIVDEGGVLDCTPADIAGTDSCSFQSFPANCDTIDNVDTLTLQYSGGSCADSQNTQGDKFDCDGSLNGSLPALVILDGGDNFTVQPGESFTIPESGSGTEFSLSNTGGQMNLNVHTSCSAPLETGNVFGSVTLQQINNMGSGTDVIYSYLISNDGDTDITTLTAEDVPLGTVPGTPLSLPAGDSVTLYNSAFVSGTVQNTVLVSATDVNGAMCSASDSTSVNILPPPPCLVTGEGVLEVNHDTIKWTIQNTGSSSATLNSLTLAWPDVHEFLKEVKVDGDKVYDTDIYGGSLTIGPNDWIGDASKRRLNPGEEVKIELKFEGHNHGEYGADAYTITANFAEGCSIDFVNTGLPFVCTKPIDSLSMSWDGGQNNVRVKAWKGSVGSTLLLDQSDIGIGDTVAVSGYAGSPNDVFWEVFSNGSKIGESNFHMSCSDNNMNGADDCGKRQGNGKSDNAVFINNWLLEGMIDNDGPFDCADYP